MSHLPFCGLQLTNREAWIAQKLGLALQGKGPLSTFTRSRFLTLTSMGLGLPKGCRKYTLPDTQQAKQVCSNSA